MTKKFRINDQVLQYIIESLFWPFFPFLGQKHFFPENLGSVKKTFIWLSNNILKFRKNS